MVQIWIIWNLSDVTQWHTEFSFRGKRYKSSKKPCLPISVWLSPHFPFPFCCLSLSISYILYSVSPTYTTHHHSLRFHSPPLKFLFSCLCLSSLPSTYASRHCPETRCYWVILHSRVQQRTVCVCMCAGTRCIIWIWQCVGEGDKWRKHGWT